MAENEARKALEEGNRLFAEGKYQEALQAYDKAIELKADFPEAWYNKGVALGELGRYQEELQAYDKAIELKADFPEAWNAKNAVLTSLEVWVKQQLPPKPHLEAYELVTGVEERLHMFIRQRLQQAFGEEETEWWHKGVSQPIRKKCADRREEDPKRRPLYNYTDLIDLKDIMDQNW